MTDTNTAQMVADLTSTNGTITGNSWVSPELGGPGGSLDLLGSTLDPLSGLASAGLGWFTSFVSFLGDGLSQLQGGDPASVSSGSQDFSDGGQNITNLAGSYGDMVNAQTANWSGAAATDYRTAATQHATGVAGLGTASTTVGSSIIGAGQVVAQAISDITELIGEAVAQIVPIMTTAISQAQETMGQSVVAAIPPCVGIAVKTALQIASKLAALLASGQNLLKLVQGALGVVDLIQQALSSISQQSTQPGSDATAGGASGGPTGSGNPLGAPDSGATAPMSTDGGATPSGTPDSGAPSDLGGSGSGNGDGSANVGAAPDLSAASNLSAAPDLSGAPDLSAASGLSGAPDLSAASGLGAAPDLSGAVSGADPLALATQSAAVAQPFHATMPAAASIPAAGTPTGGAFPVGAAGMGLAAGARTGAGSGADTVRPDRRLSTPPASTDERDTPNGMPLGGLGGARGTSEKDKEHKRKYTVVEQHDEVRKVVPPVIGGER